MAGLNPRYHSRADRHFTNTAAVSAAAFRIRYAFHHRISPGFLLRSSLKSFSNLGDVHRWKEICHARALQFTGFNCFKWSFNALPGTLMSLSFFGGHESGRDSSDTGKSHSRTSRGDAHERRRWTNILLVSNVLVFLADTATSGKIFYWGAKMNSHIRQGQLWRLITCSFLHAGIAHLMVNCYSLNAVGPTVEHLSGPNRFLTLYTTSAIASSAMSYWFNKAPSVGASGAIFGLVGSYAVYLWRHRDMIDGTESHLRHIAKVLILNLAVGLLFKGIDNWGHVGGLVGGAAVSWFIGPVWKVESVSPDGRRVLKDKAPIYSLIDRYPK